MDLKSIIQKSLSKPKAELGDRTTYIGASDLGCERKGCLQKLQPSEKSFETLIRFKRGDLVEGIVREALEHSSTRHVCQYEAIHLQKPYLKAHLDFTFENQQEIGVLECKSVSAMPGEPYEGWVKQLYYQMGLLASNHPAKKIKGAFVAMDLQSGDVRIFNGYVHNPLLYEALERSADRIWEALQEKDTQTLDTNPSPLCAYCDYRGDCPAFFVEGKEIVDLNPVRMDINQYLDAKIMEKEGKDMASKAKDRIQAFLGSFTIGKADELFVEVSSRQREFIDAKALKADHPELYAKYKKSTAYKVLTVN